MDILYLLLPLSVVLVLLFLGWSVYRGQFEDLEQEGVRILEQDQDEPTTLP
jgi:cbb3-type cytochrome oxidase maturation protein